MVYAGMGIFALGLLMMVFALFWVWVEAFKANPGWGIFCLMIVPIPIFVLLKIKERWHPLVLWLGAVPVCIMGLVMAGLETIIA